MIRLRQLILLLALGGAAAAAQPQENVPLAAAQRQLQEHITRLEGWRSAADTLYEKQAAATVDGALKAKGVVWARRYAGDWGGWVYTTWSGVRLYRIHREALDQSLGVVTRQGYAKPAQLDYLRDGMNALSREQDNLMAKMNEYLALLGDRGVVLDRINALPQGASAATRRSLDERRDGIDQAIEKLKAGGIAPYYTKQVFHSLASLGAEGPRRFIVDRLDIRSAWWDAHSSHVRGEIELAGRQIARHQRAMDKEFADLKAAGARADEVTARKHKARAQLDAVRAEIDKLKRAGLAVPPQLQATLQRRDDEYFALVLKEDEALRKVKEAAVYVQNSMEYINRFKEERARLEKEDRALTATGAPVLEGVTVSTDAGKVVFRAERAASLEEVRKVEAELAETEEAVATLKQAKDESFAAYRAKVEEGNAYLNELHGSISQGTGAWSTLSNLFSGGAIMNNARNQAMLDGAVILWEFAEASAGGPAMILADAMSKLVMEGVKQAGPDNVTNASPLELSELLKTGMYRTIEDGLVRHGRDGTQQALEKWRADRLRRSYQDAAIKSHGSKLTYVRKMLDPATSAADLKKQAAQVNANRRKLLELGSALAKDDLRKPPAYGAGSLATNVARDALKAILGDMSHGQEYERWKAFAIAASMQPPLYNAFTIAADRYWPAYDRLQEVRKRRDAVARGFDLYSGFTIRSREAFDDKAKLRVALTFRQPKGHQEDVSLGKVPAQPSPANEHEHLLSADSLPGAGTAQAPARVDLLIRHKEPKQP